MKIYLPLGSVVVLKEGIKPLMIYGRKQTHAISREEYDYVACLYPEGNISAEFTYLFNNEQIKEIIHTGYTDESDKVFINEMLTDKKMI